jgi:hypothetical protein
MLAQANIVRPIPGSRIAGTEPPAVGELNHYP